MDIDYKMLVQQVIEIADLAGRAILDVYGDADFGTKSKADDSPLTRADLAANEVIVRGLREITPQIPILSEESALVPFEKRRAWERFWLVDPLDGTKEFIKRNGEFTVNIALIEQGRPMLGVVYAPVIDALFYGVVGEGAHKREKGVTRPIVAGDYRTGTLKVVASRSHGSEAVTQMLTKIGDAECVSMGSSLKLCLVAEGAAHLYPRLGPTMEWDTAAAQAVVVAAGGKVTDVNNVPLHYNKPDLHNPFFVVTGVPEYPWQQYLNHPTP